MGALRMTPRTDSLNGHAPLYFGPDSTSFGRRVYIGDAADRWDHETPRHVFRFGGFTMAGAHYLMVWGRSMEECYEAALECALDYWPGLDASDSAGESYAEWIRDHAADPSNPTERERERADEYAYTDITQTGNGGALHSEDWGYVGEMDRAGLEEFCYPPDLMWGRAADDHVRSRRHYPDRHTYRAQAQWDADRPAREARAAREAESAAWSEVRLAAMGAHHAGLISRRGLTAILESMR